jgi:hypothetical protein
MKMTKMIPIALVSIVVGMIAHDAIKYAYAQEVSVQTHKVAWDSPSTDPSIPWTDISGAPETVATFDLAISDTGQDLNGAGQIIASSSVSYVASKINGTWETEVTALLAPQPSGVYLVWCRAIDVAGNKSAWSNSAEIPHDVTPPAPPQNMIITITLADGTVIELKVTP